MEKLPSRQSGNSAVKHWRHLKLYKDGSVQSNKTLLQIAVNDSVKQIKMANECLVRLIDQLGFNYYTGKITLTCIFRSPVHSSW